MANLRLFVISAVFLVLFSYFLFSYEFFQSNPGYSESNALDLSKLNAKVERLEHWRKGLLGVYDELSDNANIPNGNSSNQCMDILLRFMKFMDMERSGKPIHEDSSQHKPPVLLPPEDNVQVIVVPPVEQKPTPPPTPPHIRVAIGILSHHSRRGHRDTIRRTWTKLLEGTPRSKDFAYVFFMGEDTPELNAQAQEEAKLYGDIVFVPIKESYRNITHKTMEIFVWGTTQFDADYVMKMDDDSFLHLPKLMDDLETRPRTKLYMGKNIGIYSPIRDPGNQWYMSYEEYSPNRGPPLIVGCGYVISKDGAKFLAERARDPTTKVLGLEDVNTAVLLEKTDIFATGHNGFNNVNICDDRTIVNHYVSLEDMERQYQNIKDGKSMCAGRSKRSIDIIENDMSGSCMYLGEH